MEQVIDRMRRGQHVTVVALGDSNTQVTWHTAGRLNWVGLLEEALFETYGRSSATVINAGRCGDTAALARLRLQHDVLRHEPDLVVIALGMNDAMAGEAALPQFEESLRGICEEIGAGGAAMLLRTSNPVVVCNQPQIPPGCSPGEAWPAMSQGQYAACTVELARELKLPVVDHYALWTQAPRATVSEDPNQLWLRMSDAIHPNALGHLCFHRELAHLFRVPARFPWESGLS